MILIAAVIQYGLAIYAIRDLMQRERLRGANKFSWVLIILCLPFVGTLLYFALAHGRPADSAATSHLDLAGPPLARGTQGGAGRRVVHQGNGAAARKSILGRVP